MNPYRHTSPPPEPYDNSQNPSLSATVPSPPLIQTGHSSVTVLSHNVPHYRASSDHAGGNLVPSPNSDHSASSLPGSSLVSVSSLSRSPSPAPTPNPYPAPGTPRSEDTYPDLECSICFSQFNNVFRCPKMLQCKHTFCLECLARINVKSAEPSSIQCPLCRGLTPLPTLGLPRLATNSDMLSCLPAAMQRVYSIRFLRNKGKLQVKRSSEGQRSLTSLRSINRTLDVGLPTPPAGSHAAGAGGMGGALFRLTGRPACRAFLLMSVVMMMVLLTGIIIFLLAQKSG
ncbi:RING finger protein 225 [Perca flavescens]|uniref:RING finger protein 225 n=1 Tax=Perca flavescens TaxID=8167 RepID=UPI00106E5E34|nr:RING finger protein 225-like [Perca flavescens]